MQQNDQDKYHTHTKSLKKQLKEDIENQSMADL